MTCRIEHFGNGEEFRTDLLINCKYNVKINNYKEGVKSVYFGVGDFGVPVESHWVVMTVSSIV